MSDQPVDLDALFERDADARLLERRRHQELGLEPHAPRAAASSAAFGAETIVEDAAADARSPLLRVTLAARPDRALIPGAVVTVVAGVHADGDRSIDGALLRIGIAEGAEPVAGSAAIGELAVDGDALFGAGLPLPEIPAGGVVRGRFALHVLPGTAPVEIAAHVGADGVPAIAPPALRLARRNGHAAFEPPRPFYELEAGEIDAELAVEPQTPGVVAPLIDAVVDEPALPVPPSPPVRTVAAEQRLVRAIDPDEVRALERLFAGAVPHGLATITLLCSLAAADGPAGEALGLTAFVRSVAAMIPRALVAARMRRPLPAVFEPVAFAALRPEAALPSGLPLPSTPHLTRRLGDRDLAVLRTLLAGAAHDTLAGSRILVAIAPRACEMQDARPLRAVDEALSQYATAAGAWLMRAAVRRAVDRRFDPLAADDPALFAAGAALIARLRGALG